MTLGKWEKTIDPEAHENFKALVQQAVALGGENYGQIVLQASEDLIMSDAFQYLAQVLVVGNLAFDAKPQIEIGEEDYKVSLKIDVS